MISVYKFIKTYLIIQNITIAFGFDNEQAEW